MLPSWLDCLYVCLQEKLPDFDHYSTVDGVIVWPQLTPSPLTSSQSSDKSFNVSGVMYQDMSPVRPLSTKDINTEIRVKMSPSRKPRIRRTLPDQTESGSLCFIFIQCYCMVSYCIVFFPYLCSFLLLPLHLFKLLYGVDVSDQLPPFNRTFPPSFVHIYTVHPPQLWSSFSSAQCLSQDLPFFPK